MNSYFITYVNHAEIRAYWTVVRIGVPYVKTNDVCIQNRSNPFLEILFIVLELHYSKPSILETIF